MDLACTSDLDTKNIQHNLTSNKQIIIQAKTGSRADSYGSGSYREISFRKGNNNFIQDAKFDQKRVNDEVHTNAKNTRESASYNTKEMVGEPANRQHNGSTVT